MARPLCTRRLLLAGAVGLLVASRPAAAARVRPARPRLPVGARYALEAARFAAVGQAFSPNGRLFGAPAGPGAFVVRSTSADADPARAVALPDVERPVDVAFAPTGERLATVGDDGLVRVWDAASGELLGSLPLDPGDRSKAPAADEAALPWRLAFAPDGDRLAVGCTDGIVRVWEVGGAALVRRLDDRAAAVQSLAFSPGDDRLAAGDAAGAVRIWDARTGRRRWTERGHGTFVNALAFTPDGRTLASAAWNGQVVLWDAADGRRRRALEPAEPVWCLAFSPDGRTLAVATQDALVGLWDARTGRCTALLAGPGPARHLAFDADGGLVVGDWSGVLARLDRGSSGSPA